MSRFSKRRKNSDLSLSVLLSSLDGLSSISNEPEVSKDFVGPLGLNLLYAPPFPLVDFIFVHGLGGGSRKTWSFSSNRSHYWPKEWLPRDPEFKNIRIFSFGYNADWMDSNNTILNVHDFGKNLLSEMVNSPILTKHADTPIIFIGHSMGGIVIKKVCILAKQEPAAISIASRIKAIVFLATPHRGAESATLLNKLLRVSIVNNSKPFVGDLERHSKATQATNDEFRHAAPDFVLYSFYETLKTNTGMKSVMIVNRDSAVLDYSNEQSVPLNANHRGICKFDTPADPNYILLRNSLAKIARDFTQSVMLDRHVEHRKQLQDLGGYLGITGTPEINLQTLEDLKHPGSCEWFTAKNQYHAWRDVHPQSRPYYWLTAQPAAGKSVMAAHVIQNLEDLNVDCSYYFFKYNDPAKSSLSGCLRSLAYQMALCDNRIRQRLLELKEDSFCFEQDNEQGIWRKVFLGAIFEVPLERPHYFVIDALDECGIPKSLIAMLSKVPEDFPLRVFATSRPDMELFQHSPQWGSSFYIEEMTVDETRSDIEVYLTTHAQQLHLHGDALIHDVIQTVLEKSRGSFLWVSLVLDELRSVFTIKDIWKVIEDVPPRLEALYLRALNIISALPRGKDIVKIVLRWIVCAVRPPTVHELEDALKLELGQDVLTVPLETFITLTCGHLIHVDSKSKAVLARHETLRAFVSRADLESEFAVNKPEGHAKIADICLSYLNSDAMRPPRSPMMMSRHREKVSKRCPFAKYAAFYFSHHLRRSHSGDTHRFIALCKFFLRGNVLSWIELIAQTGEMHHLISTAINLKGFLQARSKYSPPVDKGFQQVGHWETDLIRLVSQFGRNLVTSPSAIFWLIPPFCPSETAIGSQVSLKNNGIKVTGLSASIWSDRIASLYFQDRQPRVVATADSSFAVGLSDNTVKIYSRSTCQEQREIKNSQAAKLIAFSSSGKLLAVATRHYLELYHSDNANLLWRVRLVHECLCMIFMLKDSVLRFVDKGGNLSSLSSTDGSMISSFDLCDPGRPDKDHTGFRRTYSCASISAELNLVAAERRGSPIGLYDLTEGELLGVCQRESERESRQTMDHAPLWIRSLVFSPILEPSLLAVLYHDGAIAVFDACELEVMAQVQTYGHNVLACSPNGRTLVTGSDSGTLQIYEIETLNMMYKIIAADDAIRSITFTTDGLRILDLRGNQCSIWEPAVLVQAEASETSSMSETSASEPTVVGVSSSHERREITAITCHSLGAYVFCGGEDGTVSLFSTATGEELYTLYHHAKNIAIKNLQVGTKTQIIASADTASRVLVYRLISSGDHLAVDGPILDERLVDHSINQLLLSEDEQHLLVSTVKSDTIYHLFNAQQSTTVFQERASSWKWIQHPSDPSKLIHITAKSAHIHPWNQLLETSSSFGMTINSSISSNMVVKDVAVCSNRCKLVIEFAGSSCQQSTSRVLILSTKSFEDPLSNTNEPLAEFSMLVPHIEHLIGSVGDRLFFLNRQLWICSLNLDSFQGIYDRHCCIPDEWFSANWNLMVKVLNSGEFVIVKRTEIAVIKRALDFRESVHVDVQSFVVSR